MDGRDAAATAEADDAAAVVDVDREEAREAAAAAAEGLGRPPNVGPPKPENNSCAICAGSAPLASILANNPCKGLLILISAR